LTIVEHSEKMICNKRRASELDQPFEQENETHPKRRHVDSTLAFDATNDTCKTAAQSFLLDDDHIMEDIPPTTDIHLVSAHTLQRRTSPTDSTSLVDDLLNTLAFHPSNTSSIPTSLLHNLQPDLYDIQKILQTSSHSLATPTTLLAALTTHLSNLQLLAFQQLQLRTEALRRGLRDDHSQLTNIMSAEELKSLDERIVGLSALAAGLEVKVQAGTGRESSEDWMMMSGSQGIGIAAL
jgi:hypothetical protein